MTNQIRKETKSAGKSAKAFGRQKGYVYTIEVMLAVAVIMFMLVLTFSSAPEQPETNIALMKQAGYDGLRYLDDTGVLRQLAARNDSYAQLKSNLSALVSHSIVFDAAICTTDCSSVLPVNRTIVTVDYYVAGYRGTYLGKKVRLWMWQLF